MKKIFNSIVTTKRHRQIGYCEPSDFGTIELISLSPSEKELIVSFADYKDKKEFIAFKGHAYSKVNPSSYFGGMSKEEEEGWTKKQGKFSEKTAIKLVLGIRERFEKAYSNVSSIKYILIGKTLYVEYCKIKDLTITVCSNMLFANWISIDIECHGGKVNIKLNKRNFDKTVKTQFARWKQGNPEAKSIDGHTHSCFSKPTNVKWGEKLLK